MYKLETIIADDDFANRFDTRYLFNKGRSKVCLVRCSLTGTTRYKARAKDYTN
jgi:hypothetical protein